MEDITKSDIEEWYVKLLKDPLYEKLSSKTEEPNIFKILGINHYEIRHSNFLAWLLNPNETHGLSEYFLSKFLQDILVDDRASNISILELGFLTNGKIEIRREWKNIDLLIITDRFTVCIENKIWTKESSHQLRDYKDIVENEFKKHRHCYVFLSPTGYDSSLPDIYINYSYERIISILEHIIEARQSALPASVVLYIKDYLSLIKKYIMANDESNQIAKELYLNHKELFDFVLENKPDFYDDFAIVLNQKVKDRKWILGSKNKRYVRFTTPKIKEITLNYREANGWSNKEAFLFEITFDNPDKLLFLATVSPPKEDSSYDDKIVEVLLEIGNTKKNMSRGSWKVLYSMSKNWNLQEVFINWNEKDVKELDKFLDEIEKIVIKFEDKLMEHKEELLSLKQEFENL